MVNNGSSTYEFCLFCNPVDVKLAIDRPKQASLKRLIGIVIFTVVDWNWLVMEANALYLKRLPALASVASNTESTITVYSVPEMTKRQFTISQLIMTEDITSF